MLDKIEDVRKALKGGAYYSATALALTFPDICCRVENGLKNGEKTTRSMYIDWVNKHMKFDDFHFPMKGFETQTFGGEMCYSLRCKVLHNGNTEVKNEELKVMVDEFRLMLPSDPDYYHGYTYIEGENGKTATCIGIDYLCEMLCDAAEEFYSARKGKSDFSST